MAPAELLEGDEPVSARHAQLHRADRSDAEASGKRRPAWTTPYPYCG